MGLMEVARGFPSCRNSPWHWDAATPSHPEQANQSQHLGMDGGRIYKTRKATARGRVASGREEKASGTTQAPPRQDRVAGHR